ncbi:hypothetical protein B0H63DRAFT_523987 [Podospora didyma]|uniref:Uncharacterized protein n=1 Tax=Podospora didyma TaxID=330526 RepID=A0AAE0NGR6_9PEZI|nr:hypothetical protein B0H63DRAFT_523987 [Podospora didyma]
MVSIRTLPGTLAVAAMALGSPHPMPAPVDAADPSTTVDAAPTGPQTPATLPLSVLQALEAQSKVEPIARSEEDEATAKLAARSTKAGRMDMDQACKWQWGCLLLRLHLPVLVLSVRQRVQLALH